MTDARNDDMAEGGTDRTGLADWLSSLDLVQYASTFADNDVDLSVLPMLTADDLSQMGVTSIGHRRKILTAAASLSAPEEVSEIPDQAALPSRPERRQITVMFCDIVGSTALAERIDAEEMASVIAAFQASCKTTLERHGGYLAHFMGDGVMAYFGYPTARENNAERAARAAVELVEDIGRRRRR